MLIHNFQANPGESPQPSNGLFMLKFAPPSPGHTGSGTYTTSSLSTKTTTASDPPNICKVKPQQLQSGSLTSGGVSVGGFSQLGCVPPLLPQQQQTPQVYVSQSAAGETDTLRRAPPLFFFF